MYFFFYFLIYCSVSFIFYLFIYKSLKYFFFLHIYCVLLDCIDASQEPYSCDHDILHSSKRGVWCHKTFRNEEINTTPYMQEIRRIIYNRMDGKMNELYYSSFDRKLQRVNGKAYKKANPSFDAWICVCGEYRDVFDVKKFVSMYSSVRPIIKEILETCTVALKLRTKNNIKDNE